MGKAKKGRRADKDDEFESDVEIEQENNEQKAKTKGKDKKKKKGDDLDDLADEMSELKVDKSKASKKDKKSKKGGDDSDDEMEIMSKAKGKKGSISIEDGDSDSETESSSKANLKNRKNQAPKKGFAALSIDSGADSEEEKSKSKAKGKKGKKDVQYDSEDEENEGQKQKGKKNKKGKKQVDSDDSDVETKKTKGKSKKGKKNVNSDDDEEEESVKSKVEEVKGKKGKSKARKASESDDDFPIQPVKSTKGNKAVKGGFALLNVEGDDDNDDDDDENNEEALQESENESEKKPVIEKSKNSKPQAAQEQKKGKKAKKKRNDSEEDIEKVLAELEMEYSGQKKEAVEVPKPEEEENKKAKEGSQEKEKKVEKNEGKDDDDQEGSTMKTAAQKKKEKKERERLKKQAQKKAEAAKKGDESKKADKPEEKESVKPEKQAEKGDAEVEEPEEDDKKKKKKGAKEDPKDKGKGPGKKTILAMQEALKKAKEEEERLQREEEEKIRQEELREQARLEQIRLEQERKDKKKLKEKQRKERLKAEGKFLTPKQKQAQQRAQAMLEALKAQGIMPENAEKRPRPGTRVKPNKMKSQVSIEEAEEKKKIESNENSTEVQVEIVDQQPKVEELKKEDEVKDSWDADSSDEAEEDKSEEDPKSTEKTTSKEETPAKESSDSDSDMDTESGSDSEGDSEDDSSTEDKMTDAERKKERARLRIETRRIEAEKKKNLDDLRAAVVCVLGHVDTGKTKILDKLRRTNVQDGEAGGITQQIGATNVPIEAIQDSTKHVKGFADKKIKIPGLLIIDTPGHESFSNLRNRGSSLCDIAVLVVDIMHGLEPQTIESINLLKTKKCPFVVALNKIDRLYDWNTMNRKDVQDIIKAQSINTQREFEKRYKDVIVQFAEQGLNAALFYENPDSRSYVSLVPTSAITGEGMGNLLALLVDACQGPLAKRLMYSEELQATVLEVKALPGLGTTIDCILVNGMLKEGDTMIVAGTDGPIVTQIRSLLMPQPLKELRVKNAYQEYREIKAAQGVKIAAKDLEKAIAGLNLQVAQKPDEVDVLRDEIASELTHVLGNIKLAERGVFVQASTLGALEALLDFLKSSKIPYAGIRIGPVVKKDVMKASIMLEHDSQYATILAFDVKIERDAQELADSIGVKIFQADIIYHLFDKFTAYREELKQRKRDEHKHIAVFPCKLKILPQFLFKTRDPIVAGVMVEAGILKPGTPVCVPSKEFVDLGVVTSVEINHKPVEFARKGQEVCIKIEPVPGEAPKMFGRHFDEKDFIISKISRQSIDACKDYFREDLVKTDWQLMVELKKLFQIL